jgi:hypothetical protein
VSALNVTQLIRIIIIVGGKPQPMYRGISELGNSKGVKYLLLRVLVDWITAITSPLFIY